MASSTHLKSEPRSQDLPDAFNWAYSTPNIACIGLNAGYMVEGSRSPKAACYGGLDGTGQFASGLRLDPYAPLSCGPWNPAGFSGPHKVEFGTDNIGSKG